MNNINLYLVEYGCSNGPGFPFYSSSNSQFFVIAVSYDEAIKRAHDHLVSINSVKTVLDYEGSLNINTEYSIKAIKLISEDVVW